MIVFIPTDSTLNVRELEVVAKLYNSSRAIDADLSALRSVSPAVKVQIAKDRERLLVALAYEGLAP